MLIHPIPVPLERNLHQLVLRVRRPPRLQRRLRRGVQLFAQSQHHQLSGAVVPVRAEWPLHLAGRNLRRQTAVPPGRGRGRVRFPEEPQVSGAHVHVPEWRVPAGVRVLQRDRVLPGRK